jgi:ribonuclease HI
VEQDACKISYSWVKAHTGIQGNEITDKIAIEAAMNTDIAICYNKIPKSVVKREIETSVKSGKWSTTVPTKAAPPKNSSPQ